VGSAVSAFDTGRAAVIEPVLTFFLVLVVYAAAIDPRGPVAAVLYQNLLMRADEPTDVPPPSHQAG
jgi:hypothetical protein